MKILNSPRKFFPLLILFIGSVSCVEDGYDLNDLETKPLTAGDLWSLPLGRGVVAASEILDVDNVEEISADANGDYIARYSDVISVLPDEFPSIRQQNFSIPVPSFPPSVNAGDNITVSVSRELDIKGNDQIIELYWADMFTGPDKSLVTVEMTLDGVIMAGGSAGFTIELPEGYIIDRDYYSEAVDERTIEWQFGLTANRSYRTTFPVKRIDMRGDNNLSIAGQLLAGSNPSVTGTPSLSFDLSLHDMEHEVIYAEFEIDFESSPKTADIGKLYDIFDDDDAVLSFLDPHIILEAESNIGMPVAAVLDIYSDTDVNGSGAITVPDLLIPSATNYGDISQVAFWIGAIRPASGDYIFKEAHGLGDVIKDSREFIYLAGRGNNAPSDDITFFPSDPLAILKYTVEIPLAPAQDFRAVTSQIIEDAFDDDMIDYLFTGGTAEIYGTVTNAIPLKFMLEMIITDASGNDVGIVLDPQPVAGPTSSVEPSVSSISFPFTESDVTRLATARNIVLRFLAEGIDDAPALNVGHELVLNLKLRKSGGIVISTEDDE